MKAAILYVGVAVALYGCNGKPTATALVQPQKITDSTKKKIGFYEKCRLAVLSENAIGKTYHITIEGDKIDELGLTYLGSIKMNDGKILKIMNCTHYFGLYKKAKRSNGKVCFYDDNNTAIGFYYVGGDLSLPSRIENGDLIFAYNNDGGCNQITKTSFLDSIPKQIFVNCTEKGGDLYNFQPGNIDDE